MMKLAVIASVLALSATGTFAGDDGPERLHWGPESLSASNSGSEAKKIWTIDDEDEEADERGNRFGFRGDDDERGSRLGFPNNDDDDDRGTRLWRGGEEGEDD
jgi:hypothetical protein